MDDSMAITSRYIMPVMLPIDSTNSGMVTQQGAQSRIWQRFWVSRTGLVDLSDAGFLVDPTSRISAAFLDSRPSTLVDLQKYRALVLLGEPGMGKSTTLKAEADRLLQEPIGLLYILTYARTQVSNCCIKKYLKGLKLKHGRKEHRSLRFTWIV
jgi:hypothetical protein